MTTPNDRKGLWWFLVAPIYAVFFISVFILGAVATANFYILVLQSSLDILYKVFLLVIFTPFSLSLTILIQSWGCMCLDAWSKKSGLS